MCVCIYMNSVLWERHFSSTSLWLRWQASSRPKILKANWSTFKSALCVKRPGTPTPCRRGPLAAGPNPRLFIQRWLQGKAARVPQAARARGLRERIFRSGCSKEKSNGVGGEVFGLNKNQLDACPWLGWNCRPPRLYSALKNNSGVQLFSVRLCNPRLPGAAPGAARGCSCRVLWPRQGWQCWRGLAARGHGGCPGGAGAGCWGAGGLAAGGCRGHPARRGGQLSMGGQMPPRCCCRTQCRAKQERRQGLALLREAGFGFSWGPPEPLWWRVLPGAPSETGAMIPGGGNVSPRAGVDEGMVPAQRGAVLCREEFRSHRRSTRTKLFYVQMAPMNLQAGAGLRSS